MGEGTWSRARSDAAAWRWPPPGPAGERAFDLLVIGDCNPDVLVLGDDVTPAFGQQEKLVDSMSLVVGGSASITAVAAARLGLRVALVAAIGDDAAGNFMLAELAGAGVDTGGVAVRAAGADRHDGRAVAGRRPGHPHRRGRHGHADRGGRARRAARRGPGTSTSAPTSCWSGPSGPAWPRCWPPPARPAPPLRSTPTGTRPGPGGRSSSPTCSPRPTCCCRTRRRRCGWRAAPT